MSVLTTEMGMGDGQNLPLTQIPSDTQTSPQILDSGRWTYNDWPPGKAGAEVFLQIPSLMPTLECSWLESMPVITAGFCCAFIGKSSWVLGV